MSGKKKQLFRSWFCRIEHEIMLPFVTVGILVVCAFCAISVYNGYTEKLKDRKSTRGPRSAAWRRIFTICREN
mgnify:CR=1 FL=1